MNKTYYVIRNIEDGAVWDSMVADFVNDVDIGALFPTLESVKERRDILARHYLGTFCIDVYQLRKDSEYEL